MSFLEDLYEATKRRIFKKDVERLSESYEHLLGVLEVYPRTSQTEDREDRFLQSVSEFKEWDSQLADLIVRRMATQDYRKVSLGDNTRKMVVSESRRLYVWDAITQYIIELWTDYGFGQKPDVVPRSESLRLAWDEFWDSVDNQYIFNERELNELSNKLLIDGEYWFVQFISKIDGSSTMRIIETDDIVEIYNEEHDKTVPVYYKRMWFSGDMSETEHILYYRDHRATDEQAAETRNIIKSRDNNARFAEDENPETDVVVFHVKYREIEGHGWPLLTSGFSWSRGYKGFLEDRATINKAAAAVVEKVKVRGGQRMVDHVRHSLQSSLVSGSNRSETNPPPASGSIWIENQALDREWLNKPTNAADAEKDGIAILNQAALSGKIYPHYLGRGDYYRLATATAMEGPTFRSFNRYQHFWASVWRTLVQMVGKAKEKYGRMTFDNYDVDINTDRIIDTSVEEIDGLMSAISDALAKEAISPELATASQEALIRMAMQTLGIPDVVTATNAEKMSEAIESGGYIGYQNAIYAAFYELWSGVLDERTFASTMREIVEMGLRRAWREGMYQVGLDWEDRTAEEEFTLGEIISEQWSHIDGLSEWLANNTRSKGRLLEDTVYRANMWVNAYQKTYNKAMQMAQNDPKLMWILGETEIHCTDCLKYSGKIKRASYWRRIGAEPQSPYLECKGINCDCRFEVTAEPLSRGYITPPKGVI